MNSIINTHVIVIGSGPSGYTSAIKCAYIGYKVVLIEKKLSLGGTCLNEGCIPSKYLLNIAKAIKLNQYLYKKGIFINKNKYDLNSILFNKNKLISCLSNNLLNLIKKHNILLLNGNSNFLSSESIEVITKRTKYIVHFNYAVIATGSVNNLNYYKLKSDYRIWNSREALNLSFIPRKFLIVGCGFVGLEIATIYSYLGSKVIDIIDCNDKYLTYLDEDVFDIYSSLINKQFNIKLNCKLLNVKLKNNILFTYIKDCIKKKINKDTYDAVLISTGRLPNINYMNLIDIGVDVDVNNFILVNKFFQTKKSNIYAIGDVIGYPMLAHKGIYQAKNVVDIISGNNYCNNYFIIPKIIYTDPEISWVGINEIEAKKRNINYRSVIIPWKYCGKALINNSSNGFTKLIFDQASNKIIGAVIVGNGGGELLGEISLAIEMGCDAEDLSLIVHAHPTLYETISDASDIYLNKYNSTII